MHRRTFLKSTSAAALSAAAAAPALGVAASSASAQPSATPAPAPSTDKPARRVRLAVMLGMVGEGSTVLEKFQIIRDCGFEGVEIDCPSPTPRDEYAAAADKTGVKIHGLVNSVHWRLPLNVPDPTARAEAIKALRQCLTDGKALGAVSVLLVPGVVNARLPYDDCYRDSQSAIREVLDLARETGVVIACENVWNSFLLSPLEAARYVDELNGPASTPAPGQPPQAAPAASPVGWHFDIGNIINFGWPAHWVRALGPRTVKLHLKDFSRKKRDDEGLWKGFGVDIGEGDAGWADTMKALDDVGYTTATLPDGGGNWATAEVGGGDRARLTQIREQMQRVLAM